MCVTSVGRRIELVSMDPHCADISIGLYRQERAEGTVGRVHTFSGRDEAAARIAQLWAAISDEIAASHPDLVEDFEFVVSRCRLAATSAAASARACFQPSFAVAWGRSTLCCLAQCSPRVYLA